MKNIDREIAKTIMGYTYIGIDADNGTTICSRKEEFEGDVYDYFFDFSPRTNIIQAFEVVGEMNKRGWILILEQMTLTTPVWKATFRRFIMDSFNSKEIIDKTGIANTPTEAICEAALKAVEEK